MRYFLVKLPLETTLNSVKYCRPVWYIEANLGQFENGKTDTTPADLFVDTVLEIPDDNEIVLNLLEEKEILELNEVDYNAWKKYKQTILDMGETI